MELRSLFLKAQALVGEGVFSLKTRAELLEVLAKHGENLAGDSQETPVDRGFFRIGSAHDAQQKKA